MLRAALEHIIRAAATIADDDEIVVIGSQAVLGQFPDAPPDLLVSIEASRVHVRASNTDSISAHAPASRATMAR